VGEVVRTVVVKSAPLPRKLFRAFVELEGMYRNMVEQLVLHACQKRCSELRQTKGFEVPRA